MNKDDDAIQRFVDYMTAIDISLGIPPQYWIFKPKEIEIGYSENPNDI